MASQAYNNNNVSLFPLQIWKQPHQVKCSKQFRVNEQDTDCFDHVMSSANVSASPAWIFLSTSGFFYFLQRVTEEWGASNRIREGCWCSCGYFFPSHFGREECC